ncbi:hypothetical protein SAMN05421748_102388 [Paractinoplanes atraurantiacus]|uniref:Uncharacterized protein n=1 Tax=Paractinoplanes atraurantiacus TaxID=1036182 RepID=A0A285GT50_9ACTN|nr:hypothetical protein SAMN05421748_102388 [Actinoplanes atraurantiacus]
MRHPILLVAAATALLIGACGVSPQDEPHPVELPRKPLTDPVVSASAESRPGEVASVLCLVRDDKLVQVVRRAQDYPSVRQQLDDLAAGPTPAESESGLSTALTGMTVAGAVEEGLRRPSRSPRPTRAAPATTRFWRTGRWSAP